MNKWIWIVLISAIIITLIIIFITPLFKELDYIKPTGKYSVGTHLFEVVDNTRRETLSEDSSSSRRLAVQVFYPAEIDASGALFPTMDRRLSEAFSKLYRIPAGNGESPLSSSIIDAAIADGDSFPVIIFSHGGFSFNTQNLSTMEELASHGYIVFAISHTYEAMLSIFPENETIELADPSILQNSMKIGKDEMKAYINRLNILKNAVDEEDKIRTYQELGGTFYKDLEVFLSVRIDDIHFFLNELGTLNDTDSFLLNGKMELDNIGMFGHSFGGITTSYICSEENTAVKAGINMDAPVITYKNEDLQLKRPFAFFYSTETSLPKSGKIDMTGTNSFYAENSSKEAFSLTFDGAAHYNFSDMNFMPPFLRYTPLLGKIDGIKMAELLNKTVLGFFDYELKNETGNMYGSENVEDTEIILVKHTK